MSGDMVLDVTTLGSQRHAQSISQGTEVLTEDEQTNYSEITVNNLGSFWG